MSLKIILIAALAFIAGVGTAQAQAPQPSAPAASLPGYGTSISVADAKKAAAAAIAGYALIFGRFRRFGAAQRNVIVSFAFVRRRLRTR